MAGTVLVELADRRSLCVDDVGDPRGEPVVFVHGTPDSRLGRHPDDGIAASLGVRLLAIDRPGFGASTPDPTATPASFGADLGRALDELGVASCALLAWSAGAVWALGAAAVLGERATGVTVAAGLVPCEAYEDPVVLAAGGEARAALLETAQELGPAEAAALIGPMLVPDPATPAAALEHVRLTHDAATLAELAAIPGATDQLAEAMLDAVRRGTAGLVRDVELQATPHLVELGALRCDVRLAYGSADRTTPPAFGRWYAAALRHATLEVVHGAGHALALTRWRELLTGRPLT